MVDVPTLTVAPAPDGYDAMYAAKLWNLFPALYRSADSVVIDLPGPLEELVGRIGSQMAVVRRSIDRLWEDQSIESCDDWVVPYLAQLLATNLVTSLDARGQRLDVANTIDYRRRKGTVGLLEQLSADITGWDAKVVEFFRRLSRRRHGLDPAIGRPADSPDPVAALELQQVSGLVGLLSGTPIGGTADLRSVPGAAATGTAFDEYSHRADLRPGLGALGWYGIPKVGVFLWRSASLAVPRATPVPVAGCPDHYAFDPTGRQVALWAAEQRSASSYGEAWVSPTAPQMPGPIGQELFSAVAAGHQVPVPVDAYPDPTASFWPGSLSVSRLGAGYPLPETDVKAWPEVGRLAVPTGTGDVEVSYHYGLFAPVGAGPYDRRQPGVAPAVDPSPVNEVAGGSPITLHDALAAMAPTGTVVVTDGLTSPALAPVGSVTVPVQAVTVRAVDAGQAVIRLPATAGPWVFTGTAPGSDPAAVLRLEGLLLSGQDVVLRGGFAEVTLSCCTLDPGTAGDLLTPPVAFASAVDGATLVPSRLLVEGTVTSLVLDRCLLGPVRTRQGGLIETLTATSCVLQALPWGLGPAIGEVADPDGLVNALAAQRDPLSTFLFDGLDPGTQAEVTAHVAGTAVTTTVLSALVAALTAMINGPLLYTAPRFADVRLRPSTLAAIAAGPTGAALAELNRRLLAEAYPLSLADLGLATDEGVVELSRCTLLGGAHVHRLECSESILTDVVEVEDTQDGCVRFSAWAAESVLPRQYESVEIADGAPLFVSVRFGEWGYAQLADGVDAQILGPWPVPPPVMPLPSIATGAENGSEMGAFCAALAPVKERSLLIKYAEYMPAGLIPVLIHVPGPDPVGERKRALPWPLT